MAFFFRRFRANDDANEDEGDEDEDEALLADTSDSSGNLEPSICKFLSRSRDAGSDQEEQQADTQNSTPNNHVTETHPQGIYDVTLPARHLVSSVILWVWRIYTYLFLWLQYLGELDEDNSSQRTVHHDNDTPCLPLLYLRDTIVFPGETLPMHVFNLHVSVLLESCSEPSDFS